MGGREKGRHEKVGERCTELSPHHSSDVFGIFEECGSHPDTFQLGRQLLRNPQHEPSVPPSLTHILFTMVTDQFSQLKIPSNHSHLQEGLRGGRCSLESRDRKHHLEFL